MVEGEDGEFSFSLMELESTDGSSESLGVGGAVRGSAMVGSRGVAIGVRAAEPNWASRKRKRRSRRSVGVK